ncbi:MAG: hypothetical protein KGQ89_05665 [Verrucomicrobia bacterium]|nr:hypothetical protein [Verrucomicrobiota bacterium]
MGNEPNTGIAGTMKAAAAEVEELDKQTSAPKGVTEQDIAEKVARGLTRDQAVEVLQREAEESAAGTKAKGKGK